MVVTRYKPINIPYIPIGYCLFNADARRPDSVLAIQIIKMSLTLCKCKVPKNESVSF